MGEGGGEAFEDGGAVAFLGHLVEDEDAWGLVVTTDLVSHGQRKGSQVCGCGCGCGYDLLLGQLIKPFC